MMKTIRAFTRLGGIFSVLGALVPAQAVAGSVFKNKETLPRYAAKALRWLSGVSVTLNEDDAKLEKGTKESPLMYPVNHISSGDIALVKEQVDGVFMAKKPIEDWPLIGWLGKSIGTIFVKRGQGKNGISSVHRDMAKRSNEGRNLIVFAEGTTSLGNKILPFRKGALSIHHNNASGVKLEKDMKSQSLLIRVTGVNGVSVKENPSLRSIFAWVGEDTSFVGSLKSMLGVKNIDVEIKVLPVIDPKKYKNYESFIKAAEKQMRTAFNNAENGKASKSGFANQLGDLKTLLHLPAFR